MFGWDVEHLGKEETVACSGGWGSEHYYERDACNGEYNCADRSDEAGCDTMKGNSNLNIGFFDKPNDGVDRYKPYFGCLIGA